MSSPVAAIREAAGNPGIRSLQVASATCGAAEAAYLVGLLVHAYVAGGSSAVALVAVIRALPSVVLAPLLTAWTSRFGRVPVLRGVLVVRVASVAGAGAAVVAGGPAFLPFIYLLVATDAVAATLLRPVRGALAPALARSPGELIAANLATSTGDSLAALVGPAIGAVLVSVASPGATFAAAVLMLVGALAAGLAIRSPSGTRAVTRHDGANGGAPRPGLRGLGSAWFVVALFVAQRFARGMLTVLLVAAAIDLLGMGVAGVGLLGAAIGFGGLVGGVVAVGLIGRRRLAPAFVGAAVLWGVAVLMPGVIAIPAAALAFLAAGGLGKVVLDVSGFTLLQRTVPDDLRGRVLGILEGLVTAALALGSVVAAALIETLGPAGALIVGGAVPLVAAAITGPALARADDAAVVPEAELRLLRAVPMFRPLDLSTLEHLAGALRREEIPAGHDVVREGELGERFYIVESGTFEALVDGRLVRTLGPLDSFGEIALLRDIPRTATVRAIEDGVVASVEREHFLSAVSSHRESSDAAEDVIRSRLGD